MLGFRWIGWLLLTVSVAQVHALERPGVEFKIFQFPPDQIPRIDGRTEDWDQVPADYVIGMDQLSDTVGGRGTNYNRADLDVKVRVGWVKGLSQLYFLYEASDDYWDFSKPDLHNDIFELVVDADMSGGPLIPDLHPFWKQQPDGYRRFQGVHAQNYHIFTPWRDKDWVMVWGPQSWIKERPYANAAQRFQFQPSERGNHVLEFWITPFDHAPAEGPAQAVVSTLRENQRIGLSWAILDYDDVQSPSNKAFWNLSHKTTMYGDASDLCAFRLMPLLPELRAPLSADWGFQVLSESERRVAFEARSAGEVRRWHWDFGDGTTSEERSPMHTYASGGHFTVVLTVTGVSESRRHAKVWDVSFPAAPRP